MSEAFRLELDYLKREEIGPGVGLFSIVRNESYFLPFFLEHHRALGVRSFVFYDDGSTDGSREMLLAQPDCSVVTSRHAFAEILPNGMQLQHHVRTVIPEEFGQGRWFLTIDADEFLILPTRFADVDALAHYLDARELKLVHAPMIGFYPERLADRNYARGLSPFEGCRWFDRRPSFVRLPHQRLPVLAPGGIRYRLLKMLETRHPELIAEVFGEDSYRLGCPWKVPLIKTGQGISRPNAHGATTRPPFGIEIGLAHFKFHPGTDARIAAALVRRQDFKGSIEYRFLATMVARFESESLLGEDSIAYEGPASVEAAGLIWAD